MIEIVISFVVGVIAGVIAGVIVYRRKVAVVEQALAEARAGRANAVKAVIDAKLAAQRAIAAVKTAL